MALSPAQRHIRKIKAAQEAAASAPEAMVTGSNYELHRAKLAQDSARLRNIQSRQGKIELKRQLLPDYLPYISGALAGNGAQDDVLTTLMVWQMDIGDFAQALEIAAYVLKHNIPMAERFNRSVGCLVAEELADAALSELKQSKPGVSLEVLDEAATLTADHDMPDQVRAKLKLAQARTIMADIDQDSPRLNAVEEAIQLFRDAIGLHSKCGALKDLESAERFLKKHAADPATTDKQPSADTGASAAT